MVSVAMPPASQYSNPKRQRRRLIAIGLGAVLVISVPVLVLGGVVL
jgi:hypothetical protein